MEKWTRNIVFAIMFGLIALSISWFMIIKNDFIKDEEAIRAQVGNINVELQSRLDKIPSLMESVKGFMNYESEVYKEISALRNQINPYIVEQSGDIKIKKDLTEQEKIDLENSSKQLVNKLTTTVERYPELKETLMVGFMDEVAETENRIRQARRKYNLLVQNYNSKIKLFPTSIVADVSGFMQKQYYKSDEEAKDAPVIDFN